MVSMSKMSFHALHHEVYKGVKGQPCPLTYSQYQDLFQLANVGPSSQAEVIGKFTFSVYC